MKNDLVFPIFELREPYFKLQALLYQFKLEMIEAEQKRQAWANSLREAEYLAADVLIELATSHTSRQIEGLKEMIELFSVIFNAHYGKGRTGAEHIRRELSKVSMPAVVINAFLGSDAHIALEALCNIRLNGRQKNVLVQLVEEARAKRVKHLLKARKARLKQMQAA